MIIPVRERIVTLLYITSFLAFTIFFFIPLQIYYTNIVEFDFSVPDILPYLIITSLLCMATITFLFSFFEFSIHQKCVAILFILAFLLWLQGNILLWNYGVLDGREIDWEAMKAYGFIDSAIWVFLIIIAFIKSSFFYKIARKASIAFILIQFISLSIVAIKAPKEPSYKKYTFDYSTEFTFSKDKNVIFLMLDSYRTDIFWEIINENNYYKDIFKGFTYFRNSLGGFPTTYPSVPLIMTGKYYDNSIPIQDFLEREYSSNSLPLILKNAGFEVEVFPLVPSYFYYHPSIISNINKKNNEICYKKFIYLSNLVFFRTLPHFFKKYLYPIISTQIFVQRGTKIQRLYDLSFIKEITSKARVENVKPKFKFFHLYGAHPPWIINERLEYEKMPPIRDSYKRQAKGMLELTKNFLDKLKELNVFDNSLILIIADTGYDCYFNINLSSTGYKEEPQNYFPEVLKNINSSALPLVLIKPFNSKGNLKISDAPVSHSDIPITITTLLGINAEFPGKSMFSIKEAEERNRKFLYYTWNDNWKQEYLPDMREFIVSGFSWFDTSWHNTFREFTPKGEIYVSPCICRYNSKIKFGIKGNYKDYQSLGWSWPEKGFTWTDGKIASLIIPVKPPKSDVVLLKAQVTPFILPGRVERQNVSIYVNGEALGKWKVNKEGEYRVFIPKNVIKNCQLKILFKLPDAAFLKESGDSRNPRMLGLAFKSITLLEQPVYQFNSEITFGKNGNSAIYQMEGWSWPEEGFTWTDGKFASLIIPVKPPKSDVVLKAKLSPFVHSGKLNSQKIIIFVNEEYLGDWEVSASGEYQITIPRKLVTDNLLKIVFKLPNASSPADFNQSDDPRKLGIAMQSIILIRIVIPR